MAKTYYIIREKTQGPDGPYFSSQIVKLAESGQIKANDRISCPDTDVIKPLGIFLENIGYSVSYVGVAAINETNKESTVVVSDINMKFSSMVSFMIKWAFATIPTAIIIGVIVAFILILTGSFGIFMNH